MRKFNIKVNGISYEVEVEEIGAVCAPIQAVAPAAVQVAAPAQPVQVAAPVPASKSAASAGGIKVKAPMPGNILKIKAKNGADVKKGEVLFVLEAMKMENDIVSPADGKISYSILEGASVATDELLAVIA
ncbi:MAG: biotin/lipoyl-binding protein [Clostridia bacterium]|nr:biotin/lipoyl-binding protein [Clostridia bacterium]